MRDFFELYFNPRIQKILLNLVLILTLLLIESGCIGLIIYMRPKESYIGIKQSEATSQPQKNGTSAKDSLVTIKAVPPSENSLVLTESHQTLNPEVFTFTAMALIIGWIGILIGFYAWAIYHYNINLGRTNEEWARMKKEKNAKDNLKLLYPEVEVDSETAIENPFKEETFGLPPGTVRGTIALSMLVGGFALLILSQNILFNHYNDNVEKYLEYFKTAFIMMIAFYFGSHSLKYLRTPSGTPSKTMEGDQSTPQNLRKETVTEITSATPNDSEVVLKSLQLLPSGDLNRIKEIIPDTSQPKEKLTDKEIKECSEAYNIDTALIRSVMKLESDGNGFLPDGKPVILFESHIFWLELKNNNINPAKYIHTHPDILSDKWTKEHYSKIRSREYIRLNRAIEIHKDSALKSCSWGLFQIMGFNYKLAGFETIDAFVEAQAESEKKQLEIFLRFLSNRGLLNLLRNKKWEDFARNYNGAGYKKNDYHIRLEEAYEDFYQKQNPVIKALLKRTSENEKETLGDLTIINAERPIFKCKTLELPDKGNKNNISRIPAGTYQVKKRNSPKHGDHFHLTEVQGRSGILIHSGNFYHQIRGCILVGESHVDINADGFTDVNKSADTMAKLNRIMPEEFEIEIS